MGWTTFWAIFSTKLSGHPERHGLIFANSTQKSSVNQNECARRRRIIIDRTIDNKSGFFRQSYRRPVLASSSVQCGGKKSNNLAGNSTREESLQTFVTQNPIFETGICSENPFLSLIPLITPVPGV
jgi:hypothetical protein